MSVLIAVRYIEVTNAQGLTHLVSEEHFTTGRSSGSYRAVCGAPVLTASLAADGRPCLDCVRRAG